MRRNSIFLAGAGLIVAVVAIVVAMSHDDSPPDVTGVNAGYPELFREIEKSWEFERPIAVPPGPDTMLGRTTAPVTN